jgi:hypothetical protein
MPSGPKGGGTTVSTNMPTYAKPFYQELLKQTGKSVFETTPLEYDAEGKVIGGGEVTGMKKYTPYAGGDVNARVAGFSPLQQQSQTEISGLQTPEQFAAATEGANVGMNMGYGAGAMGLQQAFGYRPGEFAADRVQSRGLNQYQMAGPERVRSQMFGPEAAQYYMSPFQKQVSDVAAREFQRSADINAAKLAQRGAAMGQSGNSRQALMQAEAARNAQMGIGDIYAKGQQAAFEQAQRSFQADQDARLRAQLANQQAGLTAGTQNLQALLGVQQLGTESDLRAQLANQQYGLEAQRLGEQARQYAAGLGKDIGLSGLQQGLAGSELMGKLGASQQEAILNRIQAQNRMGAEQRALEQEQKDIAYQQAMEARDYDKAQLQFYSDILRGNAGALGSQQVRYTNASPFAQYGGALATGIGALVRNP